MEKFEDFTTKGFMKVGEKSEQIAISNIEEFEDHVAVECGPGCSETALFEAMQKIADETRKPVESTFNNTPLIAVPEENFDELTTKSFMKVGEKSEQISIGNIEEFKDYVAVECEPGCSQTALLEAMQKIADETRKPVKSTFNKKPLLVNPKG